MRKLKRLLPWQLKFLFKYICSYLNFNYTNLKKLNLVSYSSDSSFENIHNSFLMHFHNFRKNKTKRSFAFLEIGPGDQVLYALCAFFYGAKKIYLIDQSNYLNRNLVKEKNFYNYLQSIAKKVTTKNKNISMFNFTYLTSGLMSLKEMNNSSFDFILSNQVFEHIKKDEVEQFFYEINKKLKSNGIASHRIDFRDHLGNSLHNLKFSEQFWESEVVRQSLMYCNRLRTDDYSLILRRMNIPFNIIRKVEWTRLPIPLSSLSMPFRKKKMAVLKIQEVILKVKKR